MIERASRTWFPALKFSPEKAIVVIATRADGGRVCISVADRGPGIPADRCSSLFTRYGFGEVRTGDSTGLGLFIVRTVVSAHGGRVSLESTVGVGTAFTLKLPVARAEQLAHDSAPLPTLGIPTNNSPAATG